MSNLAWYEPHTEPAFEAPSLAPCPLCGHIPEIKFIGNSHTKIKKVRIKCMWVTCRLVLLHGAIMKPHKDIALTTIKRWNTRTEGITA